MFLNQTWQSTQESSILFRTLFTIVAEIVEKDVQFEKILQNKPAPPCLYPVMPLAQGCQSPAAKSAHQPLPSESPCSLRELGKV